MNAFVLGFSLALLAIACLGQLLTRDWRWQLGYFSAIYLLVFVLITSAWPLELAAVKLVTGWMAVAVLGMTLLNQAESQPSTPDDFPQSPLFLSMAAGLVIVLASGAAPAMAAWARQFEPGVVWAGLFLIGLGLLQVGISTQVLRNGLGLLLLMAGFEILYAAVEASILVAGLLALLTLGIALVTAFFLQAGEEVQP